MSKFSVAVLLLALVVLVSILDESEAKRGGKNKDVKPCKCKVKIVNSVFVEPFNHKKTSSPWKHCIYHMHPNGSLSCRKSSKSNSRKASNIKCLCQKSYHNIILTDKQRKTLQKLCVYSKPL